MDANLFSSLASDFAPSRARARAFSQKMWREHHFSEDPGLLCSGLTSYWLIEKMRGGDPMTRMELPDAELLHIVCRLQALSYYPCFPDDFVPTEQDRMLLSTKYGTTDWKGVRQRVCDAHQGDYVLYDLSRMFRYNHARIIRLPRLPPSLSCLGSRLPGSATLAVLRFKDAGKPWGHRVAYYHDENRHHHFFDPNAGEVIAHGEDGIHRWLNAFLLHTEYRLLQRSRADPALTLYQMEAASPRTPAPLSMEDVQGPWCSRPPIA